jgi:hypothetical protein
VLVYKNGISPNKDWIIGIFFVAFKL